jgi:peptidoglycan/xylan/chitin deacetylase (PgdA/CDA1 family)
MRGNLRRADRTHGRLTAGGSGVVIVAISAVVVGLVAAPAVANPPAQSGRTEAAAAALAVDDRAATSAVAVAADGAGGSDVFYQVRGGAVLTRNYRAGAWSAASVISGQIIGAPAAVRAGDTLFLAARGMDSGLYVRSRVGGTWAPSWQRLGGVLTAAPALSGSADGRVDAFVRATDDSIRFKTYLPGTGWSAAYTSLGGRSGTAPAAAASGSGEIRVYVAGMDSVVYEKSLSAGGWVGWSRLGGTSYTSPAAVWDPVRMQTLVFVRGTNLQLYRGSRTASTWSGWAAMGGVLVDAPGAGAPAAGQADVVVRATDASLRTRAYRDGSWSPAYQLSWTPSPLPAPPGGRLGVDWTRVPTSAKVVALTFDAGSDAAGLASIRATLTSRNVPATMFLTGSWVRSYPALAHQVAVTGFMVGNHSDTHPYLTQKTDAQVAAELTNAETTIFRTTGLTGKPAFRFPYGDVNSRVLTDVNRLGYVAVRWTVDSLGWQGTSGGMTTAKVVSRVLAGLQPGEIVLMHMGSNPTDHTTLDAAALPTIIDRIKAQGYQFVTLQTLTG